MPKSATMTRAAGAAMPDDDGGDVLHFLTHTLQAHILDGEPQDVLEKLQNLKLALDQQENTLAEWPDSPSKVRICEGLEKARSLVDKIVDGFGKATEVSGDPRRRGLLSR
jgi:hypothetical protein